jgi:hypothetical protein
MPITSAAKGADNAHARKEKENDVYRRIALFAVVAAVLALSVPVAFAGKGGGGGSSSIAIATLGTGNAPAKSPTPAYKETVTWATTVGSLAGWETPEIVLSCYQDVNGDGTIDTSLTGPDIVYSWLDTPSATFSFSGQGQTSTWSLRGGGAATCRADLDAYGFKSGQESVRLLASTGNFPVSG